MSLRVSCDRYLRLRQWAGGMRGAAGPARQVSPDAATLTDSGYVLASGTIMIAAQGIL